tara:strand:+ start:966 stop:1259 length:294 start_codon:yes stop_codon:yes gene_type:complete
VKDQFDGEQDVAVLHEVLRDIDLAKPVTILLPQAVVVLAAGAVLHAPNAGDAAVLLALLGGSLATTKAEWKSGSPDRNTNGKNILSRTTSSSTDPTD